jgi:hypothetical protein
MRCAFPPYACHDVCREWAWKNRGDVPAFGPYPPEAECAALFRPTLAIPGAGNGRGRERKPMSGVVTVVSRSAAHTLSKPEQGSIRLLAGLGVEGDAHLGETVKHRSRVARDPTQPNLRQVH